MKKKFSRILGVALTLALLSSLFGFAAPVAAQPGESMWATQSIPVEGAAGNWVLGDASDVGDIAVSSDGTIYVTNTSIEPGGGAGTMFASVAGTVLRSTDGGQSFTALTTVAGDTATFLTSIAVAPDDSDVLIVSDGLDCMISSDAGTTWTTLGTAVGVVGGADRILDVDVSPAIPGALFGRHYVRAVADNSPAALGAVGAQIIGVEATDWAAITTPAAGDYLAVKFSPSYMGDRALAVVYNTATATFFDIISQPGVAVGEAQTQTCNMGVAQLDYEAEGIVNQPNVGALVVADIALPSDWDPSLTAGQVSYVSLGSSANVSAAGENDDTGGAIAAISGTADDDVYRIDADVANDLNGSNTIPVHSIAHDGTIDDGTLFVGRRLEPTIRYTLNPTSMSPTWKTTQKAPTGDNSAAANREACTKVIVAPDGTLYAGTRDSWTTGANAQNRRSAFSVSTDAATTFNQTALIDLGQADIQDMDSVMLSPDGGTIFMGTDDGIDLSLWKSSTPTESTTWERIYCRTALGPGLVRVAPDYADNPSIFWANTTTNALLWVSHDGGAVFSNRTPPAVTQDLTVESGSSTGVLYMSSAANIYVSTNGGYFFGLPIDGEANAVISLAMAPSYPAMPEAGHLLVGGTGAVSYSTDGADTFTVVTAGLATGSDLIVCADEAYATNNIIYAGDSLAGGGGTQNTFRYEIGVSAQFDDMITAAPAANEVVGLAINNGVLYSLSDATWGVERTLYPLDPLGLIVWDTGVTGAPAIPAVANSPNILTVADNVIYAPDRTTLPGVLWALEDTTATVIPVINTPADGSSISVDPITGRGLLTTVAWDAIGSGGGLVNYYELESTTPATGWIGTTQAAAGIGTLVGEPTAPSLTVGTIAAAATGSRPTWAANEVYMLRVRARSVVNNPIVGGVIPGQLRSHWSEPITVNIQAGGLVVEPQYGPILQGPLSGSTDVSVNPGFSWAPIFGATEYEFILALDAGLTLTVEDTPVLVTTPSWQVPPGTLLYDTTYFWGVKATEPTESPQSIGTFRTMSVDVYACPFCTETFGSMGALDSHIAAVHPSATPAYIWAIIVIGAVLMIAVIMLIVKTRRVV